MSAPSSILVGCTNKTVCVRVEGKGSFLNSSGLKEFSREMIQRGCREFMIDLRNCPMMDSTFMGTLAGIAINLRGLGQGSVHIVQINDRNRDLVCNLGLDRLFTMEPGTGAAFGELNQKPLETEDATDKAGRTQTMLEAHEALVAADAANLAKFKDVLEYLKHDLHVGE